MPIDIDEFWPRYEETVGQLLRPLGPDEGESDDRISLVAQILGIPMPRLLREFYRRAGRRQDINRTQDQLVALDDLSLEQGYLVFYVENQAVCYWGIAVADLGLEDPPVYQGVPYAEVPDWDWIQQTERLSEFLFVMLIWQCSSGAMEWMAGATIDDVTAHRVYEDAADWNRVDDSGESGVHAIWRDGRLLAFNKLGDKVDLVGGGKTPDDLRSIASEFGIEWEFSDAD